MEPQTTKVPAEKKLMKSESPLIHQGTAPPAAKKDLISLPVRDKDNPVRNTTIEKSPMVQISMVSKSPGVLASDLLIN
jgi:hypothetical protein